MISKVRGEVYNFPKTEQYYWPMHCLKGSKKQITSFITLNQRAIKLQLKQPGHGHNLTHP
jgi:hypothetical protein